MHTHQYSRYVFANHWLGRRDTIEQKNSTRLCLCLPIYKYQVQITATQSSPTAATDLLKKKKEKGPKKVKKVVRSGFEPESSRFQTSNS
jgi:hypothetical protein